MGESILQWGIKKAFHLRCVSTGDFDTFVLFYFHILYLVINKAMNISLNRQTSQLNAAVKLMQSDGIRHKQYNRVWELLPPAALEQHHRHIYMCTDTSTHFKL